MEGSASTLFPAGAAERVAASLAMLPAVRSVVVAGPAGELLAAAGASDSEAEASLAAFICDLAADVPAGGDLRGMGRVVAESQFEELLISGIRGDAYLTRVAGASLLISTPPGQGAVARQAAGTLLQRYRRAAH